jgi:hypothetical protein
MPGTTATQGLVYPVDGDRMCDGALQFELLAKGMAARYAILESTIDLAETPPALLVEWYVGSAAEASAEPLAGGNIAWNTVAVDDAGAYDAAVSDNTITLPYVAPGQLWEIGMHAYGFWEQGASEEEWWWQLRITSQLGVESYNLQSQLTGTSLWGGNGGGSNVVLHETTGNDIVAVDWGTFADGTELRYAQLWAFRIGEA